MAKDQERRRKKLERKTAKRKEHKRAMTRIETSVAPPNQTGQLRQAGHWPVRECLMSKNWADESALVQVIITRESPTGDLASAVFLVDLGLLGIKNAYARVFPTRAAYDEQVSRMADVIPLARVSLDDAAKVIAEGIAYAKQFGFSPHRDYARAAPFLEGAVPENSHLAVRLGGPEGKPIFVAGPHDDARKIVQLLTRRVGEGNFNYIVPIPGSTKIDRIADET